jgi:2-keto-3-deoxy-6-phosphogluconate aldolase
MSDHTVLEQIRQPGIVVVIRGISEEHISETVQAIDDGGIDMIEITANTLERLV